MGYTDFFNVLTAATGIDKRQRHPYKNIYYLAILDIAADSFEERASSKELSVTNVYVDERGPETYVEKFIGPFRSYEELIYDQNFMKPVQGYPKVVFSVTHMGSTPIELKTPNFDSSHDWVDVSVYRNEGEMYPEKMLRIFREGNLEVFNAAFVAASNNVVFPVVSHGPIKYDGVLDRIHCEKNKPWTMPGWTGSMRVWGTFLSKEEAYKGAAECMKKTAGKGLTGVIVENVLKDAVAEETILEDGSLSIVQHNASITTITHVMARPRAVRSVSGWPRGEFEEWKPTTSSNVQEGASSDVQEGASSDVLEGVLSDLLGSASPWGGDLWN